MGKTRKNKKYSSSKTIPLKTKSYAISSQEEECLEFGEDIIPRIVTNLKSGRNKNFVIGSVSIMGRALSGGISKEYN